MPRECPNRQCEGGERRTLFTKAEFLGIIRAKFQCAACGCNWDHYERPAPSLDSQRVYQRVGEDFPPPAAETFPATLIPETGGRPDNPPVPLPASAALTHQEVSYVAGLCARGRVSAAVDVLAGASHVDKFRVARHLRLKPLIELAEALDGLRPTPAPQPGE